MPDESTGSLVVLCLDSVPIHPRLSINTSPNAFLTGSPACSQHPFFLVRLGQAMWSNLATVREKGVQVLFSVLALLVLLWSTCSQSLHSLAFLKQLASHFVICKSSLQIDI